MGNNNSSSSSSSSFSLHEIAVPGIKKEEDGSCGMFATQDLYPGTKLFYKNSLFVSPRLPEMKNVLGTVLMNDGCFTYPENYEYTTLLTCFQAHQASDNYNIDEKEKEEHGILKVKKFIKKGEELTRKYSLDKWFLYLLLDLKNENPFSTRSLVHYSEEEITRYTENIIKAARKFGYTLTLSKN